MKKTYGVCIGIYVSKDNFMFCEANNKKEARQEGELYRRQWEISDPILAIVEIPEDISGDKVARCEYAMKGAINNG